ncbi:hypothetical protein DRW03_32370 [Corallococcus sp. H22C18031201]|uniref:hypothetical protein n=1 Tax=Citreicoccus inhibens TaxID=2849499 RepID=UPI000E747B78|nr:hypothetical protein [Citreicoccus inhibens]MBU8898022.1 hypothetical protein [Citreicoccus inhibens]RJS15780.1 hypothetical protein DRW03_32370 [Corallococcus sp. H22C18031201]
MSLLRTSLIAALASITLLSGCALRPRYRDIVAQPGAAKAAEGQLVVLRVVDAETGKPVQGAKVFGGELRERLSATTDADGRLSLQVSKVLLEENPLVEVVLPKGVHGYQFQALPVGQSPQPEPVPSTDSQPTPAAPAPEAPTTPAAPTPAAPTATPSTGT